MQKSMAKLKRFPFSRLTIKEASIRATLMYNPYPPRTVPKVRWSIGIQTHPMELKEATIDPDLETVVDSPITLEQLDLDIASWHDLAGTFALSVDSQDGTFCVSTAHNPVHVEKLIMTSEGGTRFNVDATMRFYFELEGTGFRDEVIRLSFPAKYEGFTFCVPDWSEPSKAKCPARWGVPSNKPEWTDKQLLGFVQRYIDLSQYERPKIKSHKYLSAIPKTNA